MFSPARPCSFVCLSVCVHDYSKMCAWIWMKCYVSTDVGTWMNWLTFEPDPDHSPDAGTGLLPPISYRLRNFAALPSLAYFLVNLAYFLAFSVSVCAKLGRSILMRNCNTAMEPNFWKSLSKCRILSSKNCYSSILHVNSSNTAASLDQSITSVQTNDCSFHILSICVYIPN